MWHFFILNDQHSFFRFKIKSDFLGRKLKKFNNKSNWLLSDLKKRLYMRPLSSSIHSHLVNCFLLNLSLFQSIEFESRSTWWSVLYSSDYINHIDQSNPAKINQSFFLQSPAFIFENINYYFTLTSLSLPVCAHWVLKVLSWCSQHRKQNCSNDKIFIYFVSVYNIASLMTLWCGLVFAPSCEINTAMSSCSEAASASLRNEPWFHSDVIRVMSFWA